MDRNSRYEIIKRVQTELPRGAPFDLDTLAGLGASPQLVARYAETGWLTRLAQGVYAFPNDPFSVYGAVQFLQSRVTGLHIGGKSALALQGVRHNLGGQTQLVLWGNMRYKLPTWFSERFPARYVNARLFDWPENNLSEKSLTTPPDVPQAIKVTAPERAVLEMLYEVGVQQNLEEARNLFDGLRPPRVQLLGQLLAHCTSVKTVRLFLTWARETGIVDVDALLQRFEIPTGSNRRWMSRLEDGTLLTLKPYG